MTLGDTKSMGWIEWGGGLRPVPRRVIVEARMRSYGESGSIGRADSFRWWHGTAGDPHDIVSYRVIEQPK